MPYTNPAGSHELIYVRKCFLVTCVFGTADWPNMKDFEATDQPDTKALVRKTSLISLCLWYSPSLNLSPNSEDL